MRYLKIWLVCLLIWYSNLVGQANQIDISSIQKHLTILGSDSLQGRATGSKGEVLASDYISNYFQQSGIKYPKNLGSYFQFIPMHARQLITGSELLLISGTDTVMLTHNFDYFVFNGGEQTYMPNPVDLVFVGFGIIAPEFDYNDYQNVDVTGKIVVFFPGEPASEDDLYFDGKINSIYAYPESKHRTAISRGARGSIMLPENPVSNHKSWNEWTREFGFPDIELAYSVSKNLNIILGPEYSDVIFKSASADYRQVLKLAKENDLSSFDLDTKIIFKGVFKERDFQGRNVLCEVPGTDSNLNDTYIIISAHYDHLGIGPLVGQDSIYNGVLDNALGASVLMELSRIFNSKIERTKRSLIFIFLTGEEKGLLGSQYYVKNPVVPLHKSFVNINIDGVAAFDEFEDVVAIGAQYSNIIEVGGPVFKQQNIKVSKQIPELFYNEAESLTRSDQFAFAKAGIPALLLIEGLNYKNTPEEFGLKRLQIWNNNIYHSPFDDLSQPINWSAVKQHTDLLYALIKYLANTEEEVKWLPETPFINERLISIAEKR